MSLIKNYALSAYPLSQNFQKKLAVSVNESIDFLQLAELRQKKIGDFLKYLFSLKVNYFFIALEDPNSHALLPILLLIAKIALPKKIIVVYSNLTSKVIHSKDLVISLYQLLKATGLIHLSYKKSLKQMNRLLEDPSTFYSNDLDKAKRVLYLNANLWFGVKAGGSVGHIAGVVNALANRQITVDYASVDNSSLFNEEVNYHALPSLGSFGMPAELNYYYFNSVVIKQLSTKNIAWDFIYQRLSIANFSGVALSKKLNIPLIIEYNGSEVWVAKNWGKQLRYHDAAMKAEEVCLKHAHKIVTISKVLAEELQDRGISKEKIICYPNCINPDLFSPEKYTVEEKDKLRKQYNISANAQVLTFVGTFGPWHGVDILAQAIKELIEKHADWLREERLHFMLVGDGAKMKEVRQLLDAYLGEAFVTLTGLIPQDQAPAYLAASDILLSPHVPNADGSRFFGSPTKLFEYMAMGKPIIASDLEQIGEVLSNSIRVNQLPHNDPQSHQSELAILCQPGEVQDIIKAITFIIKNKKWQKVLGENARKEALSKYTWDKHISAFLDKALML